MSSDGAAYSRIWLNPFITGGLLQTFSGLPSEKVCPLNALSNPFSKNVRTTHERQGEHLRFLTLNIAQTFC